MSDLNLSCGADLSAGPTGDLALASGPALGAQRVLRRLLTNPGDYVWHPEYGAGLARFVGQPASAGAVRAAIRAQIFQEPCVARRPEPVIDVRADRTGTLSVSIRYVDTATAEPQSLSVQVGG